MIFQIFLFLYSFGCATWDPSSPPGEASPAVEARSLNHRTARKSPHNGICYVDVCNHYEVTCTGFLFCDFFYIDFGVHCEYT